MNNAYNIWHSLQQEWGWRDNSLNTYAVIHASMMQEYRYRKSNPQYASVTREIRGKLITLGKLRRLGIAA